MIRHGKDSKKRNMRTASKDQETRTTTPAAERSDWIGRELRRVYDEAVNEPLPDRLKDLLSKLQEDEGEESKT
jgi:hypothetical protein